MQPRYDTDRTALAADDYRVRPAAEPRSWAPPAGRAEVGATFTHNAARYVRPSEVVAPVQHVDLEPELTPPPRWMMAVAGAAVAALMGALLGGFLHI